MQSIKDAAFREAVVGEEKLLIIFGEEYRGSAVADLVEWGLGRADVRFAYLGDYANSRGAADMGLLPDLLPGYVPVSAAGAFAQEYAGMPDYTGQDAAGDVRRCGQWRPERVGRRRRESA